ncbi:aminotransferase class IV [Clostridium lacusfryxellense]|uniref:aminotransferase class IV n=1 Tax=Clostridium lacusfryxellense TaxID=205328 RepID=UPI001C0DC4DC|nr:aminotransferase class IV [Clostridium lacusfryxellense]MBU3111745.1 aminotransferase class IV [Clostridium lacusfryxellense]
MDTCISRFFLFGNEMKKKEKFAKYNNVNGKSLYEVIRISDGIPIFLMEHLERLENSAKIMKYQISITRDEIIDGILKLIKENEALNENLKLVINYIPRENTDDNTKVEEKFLAYFVPHSYPLKQQYEEGVKTITYHAERSNPNAKVINNSFREKVNEQIKNKGVYEAILVDDEGFITEGSKSNIFMVKGSTIITSKVINVLPGITRQFIIKTCRKLNIEVKEEDILERDLKLLDGLFISGTSPNVLPINSVNELSFSSSQNSTIKLIMKGFNVELNENKQKFVKYIENDTINK